MKTAITFRGKKRLFAGARLTNSSLVGFLDLPRELEDQRITSVARHTKKVFVNHFRLAEPNQIDASFRDWVKEAYSIGAGFTPPDSEGSSIVPQLHPTA